MPDPDNPKLRWAMIADDPAQAEEHFRRAFCYIQKNPSDGVMQELTKEIHNRILHIYSVTIHLAQNIRVAILWEKFQIAYTKTIEESVFITEAEQRVKDEQVRVRRVAWESGMRRIRSPFTTSLRLDACSPRPRPRFVPRPLSPPPTPPRPLPAGHRRCRRGVGQAGSCRHDDLLVGEGRERPR